MGVLHEDCIFFEVEDDDGVGTYYCSRTMFIDDCGNLCRHCRLWDSYIPVSASKEEVKRAVEWQDLPLALQPPYEEYFSEV